ncbi:hypothetical protein CL629_01430 [bacterium]|nr:hypothetical protein [bacterium]|tara:strand:- start:3904 stop:4647 length:744 start_codon:yes stop_codon:yes gene_type:complete
MRSLGAYIGVLVFFIVLFVFVIFYRESIRGFFVTRGFLKSFFSAPFYYSRVEDLEIENAVLKEMVFLLAQESEVQLDDSFGVSSGVEDGGYKRVGVYSRYPYQDKRSLAIDFGERDGAIVGMPVLAHSRVLLGEIVSVSRTQSEVRTMFDTSWASSVSLRSAVELGQSTQGVLRGGSSPHVELVSSDFSLMEGDVVVNASEEFPLGILVGVVESLEMGSGNFWSQVSLRPVVRIEELQEVLVPLDFP